MSRRSFRLSLEANHALEDMYRAANPVGTPKTARVTYDALISKCITEYRKLEVSGAITAEKMIESVFQKENKKMMDRLAGLLARTGMDAATSIELLLTALERGRDPKEVGDLYWKARKKAAEKFRSRIDEEIGEEKK